RYLFFFNCYDDNRFLHSFPTRRSSDLPGTKVKSWTGDFSPDDRALLDEVSQLWSNISPTAQQFALGSSADVQVEEKTFTSAEDRSEEHTSELQSRENLVCRLLLEKKNK